MKIEIKHWLTGSILFEGDFSSLAEAVTEAVKSRARLDGASLDGASLDGARLVGASLDGASLYGASLYGASLYGASLVGARLDGARLDGASLVRARLDGASLYGARLDGASLDGASLDGARLVGARLDGASLDGARLENYAQVSFKGHGECGRMLIGFIQAKNEAIKFQCGCFSGDEKELRDYIANGAPQYAKSRTLALETVLNLLAAKE